MALIQELIEIKKLIDKGEELLAKASLLEFIDLNPKNADAWWLVSLITASDDDRKNVLEKVIKLDPTHYEARRGLEKLRPQKTLPPRSTTTAPRPTAPTSSQSKPQQRATATPQRTEKVGQAQPSQIMQGTVLAYLQKGYSVASVSNERTVMEKTGGLNWWVALTIAAISGGVLAPVLFANFFMRRKRRIIIDLTPNNRVTVSGSVQTQVLDAQAVSRAQVPVPESNKMMAFVYGTILTVVVCGGLLAGLVALGLAVDDLEVGDSIYVIGDTNTDRCIDTYVVPSDAAARRATIVHGTQVEILEIQELLDRKWYRIEFDGVSQGWLPEENVSTDVPILSVGVNTCQ